MDRRRRPDDASLSLEEAEQYARLVENAVRSAGRGLIDADRARPHVITLLLGSRSVRRRLVEILDDFHLLQLRHWTGLRLDPPMPDLE